MTRPHSWQGLPQLARTTCPVPTPLPAGFSKHLLTLGRWRWPLLLGGACPPGDALGSVMPKQKATFPQVELSLLLTKMQPAGGGWAYRVELPEATVCTCSPVPCWSRALDWCTGDPWGGDTQWLPVLDRSPAPPSLSPHGLGLHS